VSSFSFLGIPNSPVFAVQTPPPFLAAGSGIAVIAAAIATAVVVAATVATAIAATAAAIAAPAVVVAAAAPDNDQQDDDPAAVAATKAVITHKMKPPERCRPNRSGLSSSYASRGQWFHLLEKLPVSGFPALKNASWPPAERCPVPTG
jgi:hypothetical protein